MPLKWQSFQIVMQSGGRKRTPFAREFLYSGGDDQRPAVQDMRLLEAHEWPEATRAMKCDGKPMIDRADDKRPAIWVLKCKPGCWRLYFHVYEPDARIIYLRAACKKKRAADPEDTRIARRRLLTIGNSDRGGSAIARLNLSRI